MTQSLSGGRNNFSIRSKIRRHFICREGRNFCKITILEDCSIKYRALHNMERLMRGDFLANSRYIVSKYGDRVTFLQLHPSHEMCEVSLPHKIVDMCLYQHFIFILSEVSVSVYDMTTRKLAEVSNQDLLREKHKHITPLKPGTFRMWLVLFLNQCQWRLASMLWRCSIPSMISTCSVSKVNRSDID